MKNSILLFFALPIAALQGCNSNGASDKSGMKQFTGDSSFKEAHKAPNPIDSTGLMGKMIEFGTKDGKTASAYLVKALSGESKDYLLVFHEWWGLNNQIKHEADKYASDLGKVNVLAVDLYDGRVTRSPDSAQKFVQAADDDRIEKIIMGAINYMGSDARYASLGWCFGGGWSLQSGIMHPAQDVGIVMYYGMPEKDIEQIKKINAPVIGFFGTRDKFINPQVVQEFAAKMKQLHKPFEYKEYDAVHAFANPSNPDYNKEATADARKLTLDFLRKQFGIK
jgi:carboxymethylenebutenolidase